MPLPARWVFEFTSLRQELVHRRFIAEADPADELQPVDSFVGFLHDDPEFRDEFGP